MEKKRKISVSSAKAKGRLLQNFVAQKVSEVTGIKWGKDELIQGREMGQSGVDVKLYGVAKEKFPYSVECKNQQAWSVPSWIKQAKANQQPGQDWLLIMTRNHFPTVVCMEVDAFFDLYDQYLALLWGKDHKIKDNK